MAKILHTKGFTLLELLIVTAIVGIIAGITYPTYQKFTVKTRRVDAITALLGLQLAQETYKTGCGRYAENIGVGRVCEKANATYTLKAKKFSKNGYYALSFDDGVSDKKYKAVAKLEAEYRDADCTHFTINQDSQRRSENSISVNNSDANNAKCWGTR